MANVYECVGRYAQTAYTIKNTMIRVWCLEELCYYICEHAVLLDDSFASQDLLDWLAEECGLKELARQLKTTRRQSMKLESFILEILDAAHYADETEKKAYFVGCFDDLRSRLRIEHLLSVYAVRGFL